MGNWGEKNLVIGVISHHLSLVGAPTLYLVYVSILLGWCFGFTAAQVYKLGVGKLCGGQKLKRCCNLKSYEKYTKTGKENIQWI